MKNRFTRLLAVFAVALGLAGICGFAAAAPAKTDPTLAINSSSADNSFLIYGENIEELSKSTTAGPLGQFVSRLLGQVPSDLRQTLAPETSFIRAWFEKESVTDVALAITQSKPLAAKDYALKLGADPAAGNASGLADGLSYIGENRNQQPEASSRSGESKRRRLHFRRDVCRQAELHVRLERRFT